MYWTPLFDFVVRGGVFTLFFVSCFILSITSLPVTFLSWNILDCSFLSFVDVMNFETNKFAGLVFLMSGSF